MKLWATRVGDRFNHRRTWVILSRVKPVVKEHIEYNYWSLRNITYHTVSHRINSIDEMCYAGWLRNTKMRLKLATPTLVKINRG